ncbi:MAG TPA: YebC/PmpR family DNA-binding transcriptional regulator [Candidatus Bathyarchaeia archaeon]|nr:YebC/PmpR family DNA-binding transcriptional regulator [Candidatus Bathyarchaeia archaeon]
MSGHSKWSTIKHQKEAQDQKRGLVFTKLSRAIAIAVRKGGSPDPETNFILRLAIEKARSANMPKENIKKAIERGSGGGEGTVQILKEAVYEGFGPEQVGIIIETLTDNTNRTVSELKKIFETKGGSLASPGSVAYLFNKAGFLIVEKVGNSENQLLKLIDLGAEDVEEIQNGIGVYVQPDQLAHFKEMLVNSGFKVREMEMVMRPKAPIVIKDKKVSEKLLALMDALNEHDNVQKVWVNFNIGIG